MTKIVYNGCYGGFGLSDKAIARYAELKGLNLVKEKTEWSWGIWKNADTGEYFSERDLERTDPILIQVVEELGKEADGDCAKLVIEELPKGTLYRIDDYDGFESIEIAGDIDWSVA